MACNKTLQLIKESLTVGYFDSDMGEYIKTSQDTSQGNIISPLLTNIILNELDQKMEDIQKSFKKEDNRARNKGYNAITS